MSNGNIPKEQKACWKPYFSLLVTACLERISRWGGLCMGASSFLPAYASVPVLESGAFLGYRGMVLRKRACDPYSRVPRDTNVAGTPLERRFTMALDSCTRSE